MIDPKLLELHPFVEGPDVACQQCNGTGSFTDFASEYDRDTDEIHEYPVMCQCECEWQRYEEHMAFLKEEQRRVESLLLGDKE